MYIASDPRKKASDEMRLDRNATGLMIAAAFMMLTALVSISQAQDDRHVVTPETWGNGPVSTAEMTRRVRDAAVQYCQYAPVPRMGFYDIAHPADSEEYVDLGGNAVMLITVVVQDQTELPLKKVYIELAGKEVALQLIAVALSRQTDKLITQTLGTFRMDALYLLPLYLKFDETDLMTDFAANRQGFRLGTISGASPLLSSSLGKNLPQQPDEEVLRHFVQREYPGFAKIIKR